MESIVASILDRFRSIVGAKLERKIDLESVRDAPKRSQKLSETPRNVDLELRSARVARVGRTGGTGGRAAQSPGLDFGHLAGRSWGPARRSRALRALSGRAVFS